MRNTWAHAPEQEFTDDEKSEGFSIATDFLSKYRIEHLEYLNTNEVTSVFECELQSLLLQRYLLDGMKEEIANMRVDQGEIEENLVKLERALKECSEKMSDFENFKGSINKQFDNFMEEL